MPSQQTIKERPVLLRLNSHLGESVHASSTIPDLNSAVGIVVKNAFESGATGVEVTVDVNLSEFEVVDDGSGIPASDLETVLGTTVVSSKVGRNCERHGRSLVKLGQLCTLNITSRCASSDPTSSIATTCIEFGERLKNYATRQEKLHNELTNFPPTGTRVRVSGLFKNLPVRQKQVQSQNHHSILQTLFQSICLLTVAYPTCKLSVQLSNNGSNRVNLDKFRYHRLYLPIGDRPDISTAFQWLSSEYNIRHGMCALEHQIGHFGVRALLGEPQNMTSDAHLQVVLVNSQILQGNTRYHRLATKAYRAIHSQSVANELFTASENQRNEHKFPVFAIQFFGPPHFQCSWNDEHESSCTRCLEQILEQFVAARVQSTHRTYTFPSSRTPNFVNQTRKRTYPSEDMFTLKRHCKNPLLDGVPTGGLQTVPSVQDIRHRFSTVGLLGGSQFKNDQNDDPCDCNLSTHFFQEKEHRQVPVSFSKERLQLLRFVGQVDNKYIVAEHGGLLVAFDQHAIHERVRFEAFERGLLSRSNTVFPGESSPVFVTKSISPPELCHLTATEYVEYGKHLRALESWGFKMDSVEGATCIALASAPSILGTELGKEDLRECVSYFSQVSGGCESSIPWPFQRILARRACRGALMFGDQVTEGQCIRILKALARCHSPFQCAHGRQSMTVLLQSKQCVV